MKTTDQSSIAQTVSRLASVTAEGDAVLWRGAPRPGSDVDLLVAPSAMATVRREMSAMGLRPSVGDPGHTVWQDPEGRLPEIDLLPASRWPASYPRLDGVLARAERGNGPLPVASAEDRLLILAADAVAGRPVWKLAERAGALLAAPEVRQGLDAVADAEGLRPLVSLIVDPYRLAARARRGRMTYGGAARVALRSRAARAALRARLRARLGIRPRGMLLAFSGMDGAGKSTVVVEAVAALEEAGIPAQAAWARFGQEAGVLNALAAPVKRLLPRRGTVADPIAAGGPTVTKAQDPRAAGGRRNAVSWAWIMVVAAVNARSLRRSARARRAGATVVCDRWLIDSLVDLRLRYGTHRAAELLLAAAVPRADRGFLLRIDAETAARRKPGDQDPAVLLQAARLYEDEARRRGAVPIDARAPVAAVVDEVGRHLAALVDAERG